MNKLRVGVVGAGWPSHQHIPAFQSIDNIEVAAVCDLSETRANAMADEFGIAGRYVSHTEMLEREDLSIVVVCTPNAFHADIAIAAMEAGAHVLSEKPLASTLELGQSIVDARDRTGRIFMLGYQRRFTPAAQHLKRLIENGDLGNIYFARSCWTRRVGIPGMGSWFTTRSLSGGGTLIDIGVHVLDLGLWFMGYPEPTGVSASYGSHFGIHGKGSSNFGNDINPHGTFDVDDFAMAHLTFGNGTSLMLQSSWASHIGNEEMNVEIWGTRGGAKLFPLEIYSTADGVPVNSTPILPDGDGFEGQARHLVDCIRNGSVPATPPEEGLKTLRIINRIYNEGETNLA